MNQLSTAKRKKRQRGYTTYNEVELLQGGSEFYTALKRLIREAQLSIHLQTYIFNDDATGTAIAEALKEASGRGLNVYLLIDGYASRLLPDSFIQSLEDAGVQFRFFQPLFKGADFYFGRRLHHKVIVFSKQ